MKFSAILYKKWTPWVEVPNKISGTWPEDDSSYELTVPEQLRDQIIRMQNWLCDKYQRLLKAQSTVQEIERFFTL